MPVQFPWETPPVQGPPSPSQILLKRISGLGKTGVEPPKTSNNPYIKKGFIKTTSSTSVVPPTSTRGGLSNRYVDTNKGWFRKVGPGKVTNIKNTRPLWQQGRVINRSTSTSLATRGAVGLGVMKYGGGGSGQFSK